MKQRYEIINEALRIRSEITQIFADCEHWNTSVRKPSEAVIDADPGGVMRRNCLAIETMLQKELLCVHVAGPDELEACPSLEAADKRAAELNAYFDSYPKTEHSPELHARVQAWPYSVEEHAEDLAKTRAALSENIEPVESYAQAREALAHGDTVQRCTVPVETWHDVTEVDKRWHTSRYRIIRRSLPWKP